MASPVVFKLRLISPYSKDAAIRNRNNTIYIGKRPGVELNSGMAHGLFGKFGDQDFGAIKDIKNVADYISDKTKAGTNMYRCVLSLTEKDALRLGYDQRSQWEELIQQNILEIADKIPIPPSHLKYVCAVHMEKGHPHIHFTMWDDNQGVRIIKVPPETSNQIRVNLTKQIYKEEFTELYQVKNEARDILLQDVGGFFEKFVSDFHNMTEKEFNKIAFDLETNSDYTHGELLNKKFDTAFLEEFSDRVQNLRNNLPKSGRLNFAFLPPELKKETIGIIKYLIANNDDFEREFERYVSASVEVASRYSTKKEYLEKSKAKAEEEIEKRLSNKLISHLKNLESEEISNEQKAQTKEQASAYKKTNAIRLLSLLYDDLTRENISKARKAWIWKKNNLSKEARKEIAIKLQNSSGSDWGQYENH